MAKMRVAEKPPILGIKPQEEANPNFAASMVPPANPTMTSWQATERHRSKIKPCTRRFGANGLDVLPEFPAERWVTLSAAQAADNARTG